MPYWLEMFSSWEPEESLWDDTAEGEPAPGEEVPA
jgi:hypothetical protein